MFVPTHYAAEDPRGIIADHPFALVVTLDASGLNATPTPIFFETDDPGEMRLVGHIARRNPQAAGFAAGQDALVFFPGPHAYISGSWYRAKPQVPTWNYVAAQVRGTLEPIDNPQGNLAVLDLVAQRLNRFEEKSWNLADAPEGRVEALLPLIRSFRITAQAIEGARKLSQSHPAEDRSRVIMNLVRRGGGDDIAIARLMAAQDGLD